MSIAAQAEPPGYDATQQGEPTSVYRYYDRVGILIYVGITRQGMGRNLQHNRNAVWWEHVASQEVEHYPNRKQAADRERQLIRSFRPPFNKQHNVDFESLRETYLTTASVPWVHSTPIELYQRLGKMLPLEVESFAGDELVLRTRREHLTLAMGLVTKNGGTPLCGHRAQRSLGTVKSVLVGSPYVRIVCRAKAHCPREIDGAVAHIALQPVKPIQVRLDRIVITRPAS